LPSWIAGGTVLAGARTVCPVGETAQGKMSEISNSTSITPVVVPGRVARLDATPDQPLLFLKWEKPKDGSEFAHAYIVMRTDTPADAETVTETHSEDVRYQ